MKSNPNRKEKIENLRALLQGRKTLRDLATPVIKILMALPPSPDATNGETGSVTDTSARHQYRERRTNKLWSDEDLKTFTANNPNATVIIVTRTGPGVVDE